MKILICLNTAWNLLNFRSGLIRALVAEGHEVVAVAPYDEYAQRLRELGCRYIHLSMDNRGTHPGRDLLLLLRFVRLFWIERPDVYLGYTVKPNVYGSLAARLLGVPVINNIAGLGTVFGTHGVVARIVHSLYKAALQASVKVFFQNADDRELFIGRGLVNPGVAGLLPGSGIDLARFPMTALPDNSQAPAKFRFLLVARMLWEKGVGEYVEAAKLLRVRFAEADFALLGFLDVQNPTAINRAQMQEWIAAGNITYLGTSDDVRTELATSDCVVLPSYYREGTPRTLLEAAALGRPIITTDAPGCRDVVEDGSNGFLCRPRDAHDLAAKMEAMMMLQPLERAKMGRLGRDKMEREFDEQFVIKKYLSEINSIKIIDIKSQIY